MRHLARHIIAAVGFYWSFSAAALDIELLTEPGQATDANDLIFSAVTGLKVEGQAWYYQRETVVDQRDWIRPPIQWETRFSNQYLGFLLSSEQTSTGYQWKGPLKVYFGELGNDNRGVTKSWPQSGVKDRSYHQTIDAAQQFVRVNIPEPSTTLRVYYSPVRIGWRHPTPDHPEGEYEQRDSLLIVYIDADSGARRAAIFSEDGVFSLRNDPPVPLAHDMVSLWYDVKAGAVDFSYLEAAEEERGIPVNLYTTRVFVFDDEGDIGCIYGVCEEHPVLRPTISPDDAAPFATLMKHAKGQPVAEQELRDAQAAGLELMQSVTQ